mmetsp:Transcript_61815/g.174189  ORF Transcript_61815/g.174189 Transcript_61815/m.174189 type:complete len:279 (+) Transcript_61815:348-1184(+)
MTARQNDSRGCERGRLGRLDRSDMRTSARRTSSSAWRISSSPSSGCRQRTRSCWSEFSVTSYRPFAASSQRKRCTRWRHRHCTSGAASVRSSARHESMRGPCSCAMASWSAKRSRSTRRGPSAARRTALGRPSCRSPMTSCSTGSAAPPGMSAAQDFTTAQSRTGSSTEGSLPVCCAARSAMGTRKPRSCWNCKWGRRSAWQRLSSCSSASLRRTAANESPTAGGCSASSCMRLAMCSINGISWGCCPRACTHFSPAMCSSVWLPGPCNWSSGSFKNA